MLRDVARVRTRTKLPIERSSRATVERYALRVAADASIDIVGDTLNDASIKAQEPMLRLGQTAAV